MTTSKNPEPKSAPKGASETSVRRWKTFEMYADFMEATSEMPPEYVLASDHDAIVANLQAQIDDLKLVLDVVRHEKFDESIKSTRTIAQQSQELERARRVIEKLREFAKINNCRCIDEIDRECWACREIEAIARGEK